MTALPKKKNIPVPVNKALARFTGILPKACRAHPRIEGLTLVPVDKAPRHPQFVEVRTSCVPPETFYALDTRSGVTAHMVSFDANGTLLAWDIDRDGRYFKNAGRPLMCPRSVEYVYDASVARRAGQDWTCLHPAYKGTLSGRADVGTYLDMNSPTRAADRPAGRTAATTALPKKKAPAATPPRKRVAVDNRRGDDLVQDQGKLDEAAADLASKWDEHFPQRGGNVDPLPKKRRRTPRSM